MKSYDFHHLPVHRDLQIALAQGFAHCTGPAGRWRALKSARHGYGALGRFARFLATLPDPPACGADITIAHIQRYEVYRRGGKNWRNEAITLRYGLLAVKTLPPDIAGWFRQWQLPARQPTKEDAPRSYSHAEEQRIIAAACHDLREAATRIRTNSEFLARWRVGEIDENKDKLAWERGYLLDYFARSGDLPRIVGSKDWRRAEVIVERNGGSGATIFGLCLTPGEAAAACILLISITGVNGDAITATTIAHERADNGLDESPIAIIDVVKPRRGPRDRYMSPALTDVPAWVPVPSGEVTLRERDEVTTAFGIYMLLRELTATARQLLGSQRLFLWAHFNRSGGGKVKPKSSLIREGIPDGAVPDWGGRAMIPRDPDTSGRELGPLHVTMKCLRLTYLQRTQRPAAHDERTLSDVYLLRDAGGRRRRRSRRAPPPSGRDKFRSSRRPSLPSPSTRKRAPRAARGAGWAPTNPEPLKPWPSRMRKGTAMATSSDESKAGPKRPNAVPRSPSQAPNNAPAAPPKLNAA